jgi:hypothetical protein
MEIDEAAADSMLAAPANLLPHLRSGLLGEWGAAAEELADRALQYGILGLDIDLLSHSADSPNLANLRRRPRRSIQGCRH